MRRECAAVFLFITFFFASWILPGRVLAVPARTELENVRQPDGTVISVRQFGDEWNNGVRTQDGYTLLKDARSGYWVYAEEDVGGGVRGSNKIAGRNAPVGIRKFLRSGPERAAGNGATSAPAAGPSAAANLGGQPLLVIFADFTPSARAGSTAASLYNKFFGPVGSVKDYYEKASYGNFSLTPAPENDVSLGGLINDGIVSVTLNYPHPNTGSAIDDRNRAITRDALIAANAYVDFSQFDRNGDGVLSPTELHIIIVVAGYERAFTSAPCGASVWGHRWGLSGLVNAPNLDGKIVGRTYAQFGEWHCTSGFAPGHEATIGIMAHELGHDLGLPDLYDTDGSSEGIGNWSIMAGGSWNGVAFAGDSPAHFDPWSKFFEGWVSPAVVGGTLINQTIVSSAIAPNIYQLLSGTPASGEYFLIENRQRFNYDAAIPGTGLLIWHIDASKPDNTSECYPGGPSCAAGHYKVAVVPADNLFNLERGQNRGDGGDVWPGSSSNSNFTSASGPSSNLYSGAPSGVAVTAISVSGAVATATLIGLDNGPPDTVLNGSPLALTNLTTASFTFTSTKANSSFACKLDAAAFTSCSSPNSYSGLGAGSHTFLVQATDASNNSDPTPASFTWTIDTGAPDTSITGGPTGTSTANSPTFTWSGSDNVSAPADLLYAYRLDPLEPAFSSFAAATSKTYTNLANGTYTFIVKSRDQAGNEDASPASRVFGVAVPVVVSPTIALSFDGLARDRVGQGELALSPDGKLDGAFTVTLNAGSGNRSVTRLTLTNTPGGVWDTQAPNGFWSLGAATGLDTALLNASNDAVNFAVSDGGSFEIFAADSSNAMYVNGVVFTLTANFSDGTSASASTVISAAAVLPTVTIAATVANAAEGGVSGQFTINRSGSTASSLSVGYVIGGSAGNGVDYQLLSGVVTIPAGSASALIDINPVDDSAVEGNETVVLTLSASGSYTIGSPGSAMVTIADNDFVPTNPSIGLSFDGLVRDRVGQAEFALAPDGKLDGTFTITLNAGSGNRTVSRLFLTNTPGGVWDTQAPNGFWSLGVAAGLDTALLNASNDAVNFTVSDGGSFKIFAADFLNAMYSNGVVFTVTANFSDGTSASASTVIGAKPSLSLAFDGQIRDRVGQAEFAALPDGIPDGVFTVTLNAGSGNRTLTRLFLTNVQGGIWDTQASDTFWTLGVAAALDTALLNGSDDSISLPLSDGASFKVFAADFHNAMYLHGVVFTLTANFSDGSSATASAVIP